MTFMNLKTTTVEKNKINSNSEIPKHNAFNNVKKPQILTTFNIAFRVCLPARQFRVCMRLFCVHAIVRLAQVTC